MKKVLLIVFFFIAMNVWGQSSWLYDQQWGGITEYIGSGRAIYNDRADLHNNYSNGRLQGIEHPSIEQMNVVKYGLQQYNVRVNDVYTVLIINDFSKRRYVTLVIITASNNGVNNFSYYLWEDLAYRRN